MYTSAGGATRSYTKEQTSVQVDYV